MTPANGLTRADAWLDAVVKLRSAGGVLYNLVVEIGDPRLATSQSKEIEARASAFLQKHQCQPIHTVAETIFPAEEYRSGGLKKVYEYPETIYPHIKSLRANQWGTYALRLVRRQGKDGAIFNPLEKVIEKLGKQLKVAGPKRAIYELDTTLDVAELKFYDFEVDYNNYMGGQCLSHVSLKLGTNRELYLTALYRHQYYVQKALGNFKGLARLQDCVARELGIPAGPLVCHATLASLEVERGWSKGDVDQLVHNCLDACATKNEQIAPT